METTLNAPGTVPRWFRWFQGLAWYEWLAWLTEAGLFGTFAMITYDQFAEGLMRAGWVMVLLTIVFCGPGLWLLVGYHPEEGSKFGKYDVLAIVAFLIWVVLLFYFLGWGVEFQNGFGHRFEILVPKG